MTRKIVNSFCILVDCDFPGDTLYSMFTEALLNEKTEFLHLMILNGVLLTEYLTVRQLRHLYNTVIIFFIVQIFPLPENKCWIFSLHH